MTLFECLDDTPLYISLTSGWESWWQHPSYSQIKAQSLQFHWDFEFKVETRLEAFLHKVSTRIDFWENLLKIYCQVQTYFSLSSFGKFEQELNSLKRSFIKIVWFRFMDNPMGFINTVLVNFQNYKFTNSLRAKNLKPYDYFSSASKTPDWGVATREQE